MGRKGTTGTQPVADVHDRTSAEMKMDNRRRGPSANDPKRREEFRRTSEISRARKG
jgi:hypothetical protein